MPRRSALLLAATLVLASCNSGPQQPGPGSTPTTSPGASAPDLPGQVGPLDCEREGYPCDFADVAPELLARTVELIGEARERRAGGTMADALAYLRGQADVADAFGSDRAITFRLAGAPPAWLVDHSGIGGAGTGRAAAPSVSHDGAALTEHVLAPPDEPSQRSTVQPLSVVGKDTSGDGRIDNRDAKRALVLAPYFWEFAPWDESDHVAERMNDVRGYEGNVTLHANRAEAEQNVTVDHWLSFDEYDAIFISTHGFRECWTPEGGKEMCRAVVETGIRLNILDVLASGVIRGFYPIGVYDDDASLATAVVQLGVAPDSWRSHYPGGLDDTLLVLSACETGLVSGDELAAAVGGEDFVMTAWTEVVPAAAAFKATGMLVEELALGLTSELAYQAVIGAGLGSALNSDDKFALLEHISPRGAEVRLVELPTLLYDGSPMGDGADVSAKVTGLPGDNEPDRIELDLGLVGIHDPTKYRVRYEVNGQPAGGTHDLASAVPGQLPFEYTVTHDVAVGVDLPIGAVELTAIVELPEGGESRYTVRVSVGGCSFEVSVGNTTYVAGPGDVASYMSSGVTVPDAIELITLYTADGERNVVFAPVDGFVPPVPGVYMLNDVGGTLGSPSAQGYANYLQVDTVTLEILEYEPGSRLVGRVSGTVRDITAGASGEALDFSASFSILIPPDGVTLFGYECRIPAPPPVVGVVSS